MHCSLPCSLGHGKSSDRNHMNPTPDTPQERDKKISALESDMKAEQERNDEIEHQADVRTSERIERAKTLKEEREVTAEDIAREFRRFQWEVRLYIIGGLVGLWLSK